MVIKRAIPTLLSFFLFSYFSYSQEIAIEELLEEYKSASELYKKTKEEAEGQVIIFTREDLDRMQAYRLGDVLKSVRFFSFQDNNYGEHVLVYPALYDMLNTTVKLYINEHEVGTVYRRSVFPIWGDISLDNVEHIEIYLGETSIKFGNEIPGVLIRLFTRLPEKENTRYFRGTGTSRGGYSLNYYDARELENGNSYLLFFEVSDINRKDYYHIGSELSRDSNQNNLYFNFKVKGFLFEYNHMYKKSYRFLGSALDNAPDSNRYTGRHQYISITKNFLEDKSLKFNLSYDYIVEKEREKDDNGVLTYNPRDINNPVIIARAFNQKISQYSYRFYISKNFKLKRNDITIGGIYKNNRYILKGNRDLFVQNMPVRCSNKDQLLSVFFEDEFSINDENLIVAGIKYSTYNRQSGYSDIDGYFIRLGYIFVPSKNFYGKILAADYFTPPSFFELSTNPNLKKQRSRLIGTEVNYVKGNNKFLFSGAYVSVKDNISLHPVKFTYFNFGKKVEYFLYSLDYEYKFNKYNKIMLNYYYADISRKDFILGTREGGFLKLFNNFNKFDTYLELSYRKGYLFKPLNINIKDGYDLIFGINYHLDESTTLSVKGENLLNEGLKTPYLGLNPVVIPTVDKRVLISLKRFF